MKNIIPFKKEVIFKTNIEEITSISLEHNLSIENSIVKGNFLIVGEYKVSEKSTSVDSFSLDIPFEIVIDDKYETKKATIDIDDFYYEIINNNVLSVSIDVLLDCLEEKPIVDIENLREETPVREILDIDDNLFDLNLANKNKIIKEQLNEDNIKEKKLIDEEETTITKVEDKNVVINSLFSNISNDTENYIEYNVYILREGDSIDTIIEKYNTTLEEIKKYNDLENLQLGDKLIIPNTYERN